MEESSIQSVIIKNRKSITATGVKDIETLAEDYLVLNTKDGKMFVEGRELKVNELIEGEGKISITGDISGVFFKTSSESRGVFGRIFK